MHMQFATVKKEIRNVQFHLQLPSYVFETWYTVRTCITLRKVSSVVTVIPRCASEAYGSVFVCRLLQLLKDQ